MTIGCWLVATHALGQRFSLEQKNDTLSFLSLKTDSTYDKWRLPYPVYRFCTGDVDGDGSIDAMVGVIKSTRYYQEKGHRLFIFKNYHGLVRPLWLGSKLGGILEDFRFKDGLIRASSVRQTGNMWWRSIAGTISAWLLSGFWQRMSPDRLHWKYLIMTNKPFCL